MKKLLAQGAEAKIILVDDFIIKDRIKKSYRHPQLDEKIRKIRTRAEAKNMTKASKIINCPEPFFTPDFQKIKMPYIKGKKLSQYLDSFPLNKQKQICKEIGNTIAKLHNANIIHGDLTTSNMILKDKDNVIYFIDFGLSFFSHRIEDKAVDLHLLKQALESKHYKIWEGCFKTAIQSYKKTASNAEEILKRFEAVEKRGRYKRKKK